jgi:hypothetical protein
MKLIFLYGLPATGKLAVAVELAAMTGYKLFHNHLVVDLLLSVFEFGSPPFVEMREEIWLSVFEQLHAEGVFDGSHMPEPRLSINTSLCTPNEAAMKIARTLEGGRSN